MRLKSSPFLLTSAAVLALSACNPVPIQKVEQFWQRENVSEAVYAQGPKAQQMLNRDIARCVFEMQELERLGVVKDAIPTNAYGMTLDPDEQRLADNDTPERDQNLLMEHNDYLDFEGCMQAKGWERIKYVPFDVAAKGRVNYDRVHIDKRDKAPTEIQKKTVITASKADNRGDLNR